MRLYMTVMLTKWKQIVKHGFPIEKTASCHSGYSKYEDLKMSFVRIGRFVSDLDFRLDLGFSSDWIGYFFRIGYIKSTPV